MEIIIQDYLFEYSSDEPRAIMFDYDYLDGNRFPITHINHLVIKDRITQMILLRIDFQDQFLDDICSAIMQMCDNLGIDNNDANAKRWSVITINIQQYPFANLLATIQFVRQDGNVCVTFTGCIPMPSEICILMEESDLDSIYDLFNLNL